MQKQTAYFFLLAFFEGAAVMACELLGAKMIAPFFGSSLYVWAAVLGITLTGLMSGYYLGGYLSGKEKYYSNVTLVLAIAAMLLIIMPFTGEWLMERMLNFSIQAGSTLSLMFFLMPPLLLMGASSPLIIRSITTSDTGSGRSAGYVYAVSTFGGIIATFFIGFYFLPEFGILKTALFFGSLLLLVSLYGLFKKHPVNTFLLLIPALFCLFLLQRKMINKTASPHYRIVYQQEGMLGQIRVIDQPFNTYTRGVRNARILLVNNTGQTITDRDNPDYSLWDWAYYYPTAASIFPPGSDVLLLGLGGGTFVKQLERLKFNVDVVELDKRVKEVAVKYFNLSPGTNVVVDDARHYINTAQKKYDIVMMDLFLNETPPAHVLTLESFEQVKEILKPGGMIMINFYGYITGDIGKPARSVYKTLTAAGFTTHIFPTPGIEAYRNLIFLASLEEKDFSKTTYEEKELPRLINIQRNFINTKAPEFNNAIILWDKTPSLEKLYAEAALAWRYGTNKYYTERFVSDKVKMFK